MPSWVEGVSDGGVDEANDAESDGSSKIRVFPFRRGCQVLVEPTMGRGPRPRVPLLAQLVLPAQELLWDSVSFVVRKLSMPRFACGSRPSRAASDALVTD